MEKQRKYELTKEDLETLIFLAANRICDQKKDAVLHKNTTIIIGIQR